MRTSGLLRESCVRNCCECRVFERDFNFGGASWRDCERVARSPHSETRWPELIHPYHLMWRRVDVRTLAAVALLLAASEASAQTSSRTVGDFHVSTNRDPMTDEDRSFAFVMPLPGGSSGLESLAWKCEADGLNILVSTKYLAGDSDNEIRVQVRFPPSPAETPTYWGEAAKNQLWWMPMRAVPSFTQKAIENSEVIVRVVDPLDGETLTASFRLRGLRDALRSLPCYRGPSSNKQEHQSRSETQVDLAEVPEGTRA